MRAPLVIALVGAALQAPLHAITPAEAADGWIQLFDGSSLYGWTSEGAAKWRIENGALVADPAAPGFLRSNSAFADFILKGEFRTAAGGASAIFLRWEKHGKPEEEGYKLQIDDSDAAYPTGSLRGVLKATPAPPKPGEWRTLEVTANGDHFVVRLDGATVLDGKDPKFRTGFLRLQSRPGARVEFRNLRLKPLGVESLFNGADLAGWKQVAPPPGKPSKLRKVIPFKGKPKPAVWAAEQGSIHVKEGPDQLESQKTYADFILQVQVRADSKDKKRHPEGAIAFRGDPGKFESGYRVIIHNDGNTPTGSLDELQPSRMSAGQDNTYSLATIAAYGRHIAVWINGLQVNDYEDKRADGIARTAAGTVALSHAPETLFDFRNINVESLPKAAMMAEAPKPDAPASAGIATPQSAAGATASAAPPAPAIPSVAPAGPLQIPGQAEEKARRDKVSDLTAKSLQSDDPEEQVRLNTEILKLDPANQVAYNALKSAQEKIQQAQAKQAQQETVTKQQTDQSQAREAARRDALQKAEDALLANDFKKASEQLAIVRSIAPNDAEALVLAERANKQLQDRKRLMYTAIGGAAGGLALLGGLLLVGRGKKIAYVEIVTGVDEGKRFEFSGDVLHIGAIEQDGGSKNEVVVHDPERMISRFHCEIHRRGSRFYVFDLKSANGTFVDRKRIKPGQPVRVTSRTSIELAGACSLRLGRARKSKAPA